MKKIGKYAFAVILGIIFSIPVVTVVASITAVHFVSFKLFEDDSVPVFKEFIKSFKQNLVQSFAFLIIIGGIGAVLVYLWINLFKSEDINFLVGGLLLVATLLFFNFESLSTYLLSKFENKTGRLMAITIYASMQRVDVLTRNSFLELCIVAVPAILIAVNPCIVTYIVGGISAFILCVVFEMVSAKAVIPIFNSLIKQQEQATNESGNE